MWILVLGLPVGIIFGVLFGTESTGYSQLALLGLASLGLAFARTRLIGSSRVLVSFLLLILVVACGWFWGALASHDLSPWRLSAQTYYLSGTIDGVPLRRFHGQQARLRLDCVGSRAGHCDQYQRFWWHAFWRQRPNVEVRFPGELNLEAGSRIQFDARFRPQEKEINPGAFDSERWMLSNHLVARFELISGSNVKVLSRSAFSIDRFRVSLHNYLQMLRDAEPRPDMSGYAVLLALISGDRSLMSVMHWDIFNRTGTTHLVAISGLHIGLVAAFVILITTPLFRRWRWLTNRFPAHHGAILIALLVALAYAAAAGFGLPTQRAIIMLLVFVSLKLLGRVQPLWLGWSLAFCLTLLWDPVCCLSLGFWLSFLAVYLILWLVGGRVVAPSRTRAWIRVQVGLTFGLAPVLLWQVQATSMVSIVTNLFAVPLVGFLVVPLALTWAVLWSLFDGSSLDWLAEILLRSTVTLVNAIIWLLEQVAANDWSVWAVGGQTWKTMLLATVGILWLLSKGIPGRLWGTFLFFPALMPQNHSNGLYVLQHNDLRMAIRLQDKVLFVSKSHWPQILPNWHKTLLQQWGIPVPEAVIPVQAGETLWQAGGLVVSEYSLRTNWLGQSGIEQIRFVDPCASQQALEYGALVLEAPASSYGEENCALQWILGEQRGQYWPTASVRYQSYLLKHWRIFNSGAFSADSDIRLLVINKKPGEKVDPQIAENLRKDGQIVLAGPMEGSPWLLQKEKDRRIHNLDQNGYFFLSLQDP